MAEPHPYFVLDESALPLAEATPAELQRLAEHVLATLTLCKRGGRNVARISWLWESEVLPGIDLATLLFQPPAGFVLDKEVRDALQVAVSRCVEWDVLYPTPPLPEVEVAGGFTNTVSLAFAVRESIRGRATALIPFLGDHPNGIMRVQTREAAVELSVIGCREHLVPFWRTVPVIENLDGEGFMALAYEMFPASFFHPDLATQTGHFSQSFRELRAVVIAHLAALNDHYRTVYDEHGGENGAVRDTMRARAHIDISPESPNTHRNAAAMAERDVTFAGVKVRCEWHAKLAWDVDRIHFCYGHPGVAGGARLLVGIFARHLTT